MLCDWYISTKLKEKFYKAAIRLATTNRAECYPITKQHMQKMSVVDLRMLRWMCDKARKDRIRSDLAHSGVFSGDINM